MVVGTVDECDLGGYISLVLELGSRSNAMNLDPGCARDPDFGLQAIFAIIDVSFLYIFPTCELACFCPGFLCPVTMNTFIMSTLLKILFYRTRRKVINDLVNPTQRKLIDEYNFTETESQALWADFIEPLLLSLDPFDLASLKEDVPGIVQLALLYKLRPQAVSLIQDHGGKKRAEAEYLWSLAENAISSGEVLDEDVIMFITQQTALIVKEQLAHRDVKQTVKSLIDKLQTLPPPSATVGAPIQVVPAGGGAYADGDVFPLKLASHSGKALVFTGAKTYPAGVGFPGGKYAALLPGNPDSAVMLKVEGPPSQCILRKQDDDLALEVSRRVLAPGTDVVLWNTTPPADAAALSFFTINADGTICPHGTPHLAVGLEHDKLKLVERNSAARLILKRKE